MPLPKIVIIDTPEAAAEFQQNNPIEKTVAIDTESNSLHAYREKVCLIQMTANEVDYIIDPIRLDIPKQLPYLGKMLADPSIEKVFHAGEYDIICLKRDYGYEFNNVFDTMIASRILGVDQIGLDKLLLAYFDIQLDKQYQLHNWARRPLKKEMLHYARMDTHYLIPLRDILADQLVEKGHWEEAIELFEESTHVEWSKEPFSPEQFWKIKGAHHIKGQDAAILRELFVYREREAERRDLPVFKIISDATLVEIAKTRPATLDELRQIRGVGKRSSAKFGEGILTAINRGLTSEIPGKLEQNHRPDEAILNRYELLSEWRKNRARGRGVSSEVVASKEALWEIARLHPRTMDEMAGLKHLGPWRLKTYGEEILGILSRNS